MSISSSREGLYCGVNGQPAASPPDAKWCLCSSYQMPRGRDNPSVFDELEGDLARSSSDSPPSEPDHCDRYRKTTDKQA